MDFSLIFLQLLNSLIGIDLDTIQTSLFISRHYHPLIPYQTCKYAFSRVRVFQNNFIRQSLIGIYLLIKGCSNYKMFLRYIKNWANVEPVVAEVAFLYLKCSFSLLQLYLMNYVQISCRISSKQYKVIYLSIMKIYSRRIYWNL